MCLNALGRLGKPPTAVDFGNWACTNKAYPVRHLNSEVELHPSVSNARSPTRPLDGTLRHTHRLMIEQRNLGHFLEDRSGRGSERGGGELCVVYRVIRGTLERRWEPP